MTDSGAFPMALVSVYTDEGGINVETLRASLFRPSSPSRRDANAARHREIDD